MDDLMSTGSKFNEKQYKFYNEVQNNLNDLNNNLDDDLKQIQINTYYYKKYKAENYLLYFINITIIIVIIIRIIKSFVPFLDNYSYSVIVGFILGVSLIYVIYLLWIMMNKDDQNYDEDDYKFNSSSIGDISNNDNINRDCAKNEQELSMSTLTPNSININVDDINLDDTFSW
jgi:amino acid permease